MNPAQLVMDVEGFDTYARTFKISRLMETLQTKLSQKRRIELSDAKPVYLPDGF